MFLLFTLTFVMFATSVLPFETDQYHLPPEQLFDVGPEVSEYLIEHLKLSVAAINERIENIEACVSNRPSAANCPDHKSAKRQLAELKQGHTVAEEFFKRVGDGNLFVTKFGRWFREHKFRGSPDRYAVTYADSIYFFKPSNQLTLSPTLNVYGTSLGLDKLEHLLQQGWRYYTIRRDAIAAGKSVEDAERRAVDWGRRTERTYYGLMVSGVYSNGDLAANYAGMMLYRAFYESISLSDSRIDPILKFESNRWSIANEANERTLKPFISDHLNEALNPSILAFNIYPTVKRVVRDSACPEWRERFVNEKVAELRQSSTTFERWHGMDYGHRKTGRSVSILTCFDDQSPSNSTTTRSAS